MNDVEKIIWFVECKSVPALILKDAVWWAACLIFALLLSNFVMIGCFVAQTFGVTLDVQELVISGLFMLFCVSVIVQIYAYVVKKFSCWLALSVFFFMGEKVPFESSHNATIAKILDIDVEDVVWFKENMLEPTILDSIFRPENDDRHS
ncbi:MAG: hypothetical protein CMP20_01685 [Rickettsiales bacterium]|nr:hypothetical protein [Rickettsiales bacterium]